MSDYLPGSFFLTEIPGAVGFAINLGQALCGDASRYSHAGLVLGTDGTILEAEPGGGRIANLSEYAGQPLLISDGPVQRFITAPPCSSAKMTAYAEDYIRGAIVRQAKTIVGVPYSALDYVALGLLHLHLPSTWIRERVQSSGHMICSQLVDAVYERAGVHLFDDGRLPGDVMPADLAAWAEDWQASR